ncbi:MAG: cytochrome c [Cytophagales bacterium]|nr:cytochrome c [Cytophagales bacterium]
MEEEIVVNGKPYFNTMPNYRFMKDQEIADVLTYLRTHMGNAGAPISPDEVKALRKKK